MYFSTLSENDMEKLYEIYKKNWDQISKIAFRTFVPESEESRSKGAGGGDAND